MRCWITILVLAFALAENPQAVVPHEAASSAPSSLSFELIAPSLQSYAKYTRVDSLERHAARRSFLMPPSRQRRSPSLSNLPILGRPALAYSVNVSLGTPPQSVGDVTY
jgi:hypothetical protein